MHKCLYFAVWFFSILLNLAPSPVALAQEQEKPAIAPISRTINLTQEQRFIIKENLKDLHLPKASSNAPETIGDVVPQNIELHSLPTEATRKVPQARSHLFFMKDNNAIVLGKPQRSPGGRRYPLKSYLCARPASGMSTSAPKALTRSI